jgi:uncharacterized protein
VSQPLPFLRPHPDGVQLSLKIQPRAARTEFGQVLGTELKLKVSAPPVDSAANEAVIEVLAELLHCSKGAVRLIRGRTSRHKQFLLAGLDYDAVERAFRSVCLHVHP